jgi:hypothetical protein
MEDIDMNNLENNLANNLANNPVNNLEKALAKTESDVDATLKAAFLVVKSLKELKKNVKTGVLRDFKKSFASVKQADAALTQQINNTEEGWNFDCENYVAGRAFIDEILEMAASLGVKMFEQDERLYCYPLLIRILPNELAVQIDKRKEKLLRPSALLSHLKTLQNKPVRFKSDAFLESLYSAYEKSRGRDQVGKGIVIPLLEIYRLLTLLPGLAREYSRQEFARDIYLLDRSSATTTKNGFVISFPGSTGLRSTKDTISVVTEEGLEKRYYGISFSAV